VILTSNRIVPFINFHGIIFFLLSDLLDYRSCRLRLRYTSLFFIFILLQCASYQLPLLHVHVAARSKRPQKAWKTVIEAREHAREVPPWDMLLSINLATVSEAEFRYVSCHTTSVALSFLYKLNDRVEWEREFRLQILLLVHAVESIEYFIDVLHPLAIQIIIHQEPLHTLVCGINFLLFSLWRHL